jgi:hypothetical protein
MRWGWVGLVIVSTIGYLWLNPLVVIVQVGDEDEEDQAEPEKDDGVGSLEDEEVDE